MRYVKLNTHLVEASSASDGASSIPARLVISHTAQTNRSTCIMRYRMRAHPNLAAQTATESLFERGSTRGSNARQGHQTRDARCSPRRAVLPATTTTRENGTRRELYTCPSLQLRTKSVMKTAGLLWANPAGDEEPAGAEGTSPSAPRLHRRWPLRFSRR